MFYKEILENNIKNIAITKFINYKNKSIVKLNKWNIHENNLHNAIKDV